MVHDSSTAMNLEDWAAMNQDNSVSTCSHFKHTPLQDPHGCVRLISFENARSDGKLSFRIADYKLSDLPSYNALSYEWGSRDVTRAILVNGKTIKIFGNLYDFLKQLQSQGYTMTPVFADAICIDQENIPERNAQVQGMGRVYSQASAVLAWLGPAADGSDTLLDACLTLWQLGEHHPAGKRSISSLSESGVPSIAKMLHRSYWSRLWIVQELYLARETLLFCGHRSLPWRCFSDLYAYVSPGVRWERQGHDLAWAHFGRLLSLVSRRTTYDDFLSLVIDLGNARCHDIRDRIFGLLGVCEGKSRFGMVQVDYAAPVEILCLRLMRGCSGGNTGHIKRLLHLLQLEDDPWRLRLDRPALQPYAGEFCNSSQMYLRLPLGRLRKLEPSIQSYTQIWSVEPCDLERMNTLQQSCADFVGSKAWAAYLRQTRWERLLDWRCITTAHVRKGDEVFWLAETRLIVVSHQVIRPEDRHGTTSMSRGMLCDTWSRSPGNDSMCRFLKVLEALTGDDTAALLATLEESPFGWERLPLDHIVCLVQHGLFLENQSAENTGVESGLTKLNVVDPAQAGSRLVEYDLRQADASTNKRALGISDAFVTYFPEPI